MSNTGWTTEWPAETGMYWFYGRVYASLNYQESPPQWMLVKVRPAKNIRGELVLIYVNDLTGLMERSDDYQGIWRKVELPEIDFNLLNSVTPIWMERRV